MDTILFSIFFIAYLVLLALAIVEIKKYNVPSTIWLLPVIAGLVYDNGIISFGRCIGEGQLLESLNLARLWIHALFTPFLVLFAWKTLKQADYKWAKKNIVQFSAFVLTTLLILIEFFTVVLGLNLEPKWEYGVLSYSNTETSGGPPLMVLIVSFVLLAASILIWIKQKWVWFFIGSLLMILGSAIQLPIQSGAITNLFELVLISSLLGTAYFQRKNLNSV